LTQIILIERSDTGPGNLDIEFNYDRIRWETGDIDSPTDDGFAATQPGSATGNDTGAPGTFFELAGSGVPGSFPLRYLSDVNTQIQTGNLTVVSVGGPSLSFHRGHRRLPGQAAGGTMQATAHGRLHGQPGGPQVGWPVASVVGPGGRAVVEGGPQEGQHDAAVGVADRAGRLGIVSGHHGVVQ
jgi:hypothetical protein